MANVHKNTATIPNREVLLVLEILITKTSALHRVCIINHIFVCHSHTCSLFSIFALVRTGYTCLVLLYLLSAHNYVASAWLMLLIMIIKCIAGAQEVFVIDRDADVVTSKSRAVPLLGPGIKICQVDFWVHNRATYRPY